MKDAYAQAVFTLQWNQKTEQNTEVLCPVQRCGDVSFVFQNGVRDGTGFDAVGILQGTGRI